MSKAVFRAMTDEEARAARALGAASFSPASSPKRIARKIAAQVPARRITEKQAAVMWKLIVRFRRSIEADVVELARAKTTCRVCMPSLFVEGCR